MNKNPIIISTNLALSQSQNTLRYSKAQNRLLKLGFLIQMSCFSFALLAITLSEFLIPPPELIIDNIIINAVSATLLLISGYLMGFSKIISRKTPVNIVCLIIYNVSLSFTLTSIHINLSNQTAFILVGMALIIGVINMLYLLSTNDYYSGMKAFLASFGVNMLFFMISGFLMKNELNLITFYFILSGLAGFIICIGIEKVVKNQNYDLLKDDYLLVGFKIITILPLVNHAIYRKIKEEDD